MMEKPPTFSTPSRHAFPDAHLLRVIQGLLTEALVRRLLETFRQLLGVLVQRLEGCGDGRDHLKRERSA